MKKKFCLLMMLVVFTGAGCVGGGQEAVSQSNEEMSKVSITADVTLKRDAGSPATTCLGSAAFAFDFYIDRKESGDTFEAEGYYQLTDYMCEMVGSMKDCTATPKQSAYQQRDLKARLMYTGSELAIKDDPDSEEGSRGDRSVKSAQLSVLEMPVMESFEVEWFCLGPGSTSNTQDDAALLTQLVLPFAQEQFFLYPEIGHTDNMLFEDIELYMGVSADVYITYSESITDLN